MALMDNSLIEIVSFNPIGSPPAISKVHYVSLIRAMKDFAVQYLGTALTVSELERVLAAPFNAYEDGVSRKCHGMKEFQSGGEDYLLIKKLGMDPESDANADFMYLMTRGNKTIYLGFFRLDDSRVLGKQEALELHYIDAH